VHLYCASFQVSGNIQSCCDSRSSLKTATGGLQQHANEADAALKEVSTGISGMVLQVS